MKVPHFLPASRYGAAEFWGQRACYLFLHISFGLGFTAGEATYELLQMTELFEQSGLHDGFTQLQVKRAAWQYERRVVIETLQDVGCRKKGRKKGRSDIVFHQLPNLHRSAAS